MVGTEGVEEVIARASEIGPNGWSRSDPRLRAWIKARAVDLRESVATCGMDEPRSSIRAYRAEGSDSFEIVVWDAKDPHEAVVPLTVHGWPERDDVWWRGVEVYAPNATEAFHVCSLMSAELGYPVTAGYPWFEDGQGRHAHVWRDEPDGAGSGRGATT